MGFNMTLRLLQGGHQVVAWNRSARQDAGSRARGRDRGAHAWPTWCRRSRAPRVVWIMLPAGQAGGRDDRAARAAAREGRPRRGRRQFELQGDQRRARAPRGGRASHFADCGTSGGIWGLEERLLHDDRRPDEAASRGSSPRSTRSRRPTAGCTCGPAGAGHFAKMIHNGIEYGMMQAYAEGFEILKASDYHVRPREALAPVEPGQRGALVAARAGRAGVREGPGAREDPRLRRGLGRGPLDGAGGDRPQRPRRGADARAHAPLPLAPGGLVHATACSRRCATSSAGTP